MFLINQITANEIIILMTPYCPTTQHLLHMQEVNLLSLKIFGESKSVCIPKFLLKLLRDAFNDVR